MAKSTQEADTITDAALDAANERADELFAQFMDDLAKEPHDPCAIIFSFWISFTHMLIDYGWTANELAEEVIDHSAHHTAFETDGSA